MPRAAKNPVTGLTEKQEAFALECIRLGDGARAYRKVYDAGGFTQNAVWAEAGKLLHNPVIAARVRHWQAIADRKLDATVERIAEELGRIAFFDPRELFDDQGNPLPISDLPNDVARAIAGLDVEDLFERDAEGARIKVGAVKKYKIANKITALEILAKWKRMLIDRMEVGAPGEFDRLDDDQLEAALAREEAELARLEKARKSATAVIKKAAKV